MPKTPGFPLVLILPAVLVAGLAEKQAPGQDKTADNPLAKAAVDVVGDPLPRGAVARCGTVRFRHSGGVCQAVLSKDGKTLVTVGGDTAVYLWEFPSGKLTRKLEGHRYPIANVVMAPDGKKLFASDLTQTILAWDLASAQLVAAYFGDKGGGLVSPALVVSPDGKLLADVTSKGKVRIRNVETGKDVHLLPSEGGLGLAFAPDSSSLAVAAYGHGIEMWDTATGKLHKPFKKSRIPASAVVFTGDGKSLIVAAENAIHVYDAATGKEIRQIRINRLWPQCMAVSSDGKTLAVPLAGGELGLWDITTGLKLRWKTDHFGHWPDEPEDVHLSGVAFAAGDTILITTAGMSENGQHVGMWDVATGKPLHSQVGHKAAINGMALSRDGKTLASASSDGTLRLWDPATGLERLQATADDGKTLLCVAMAPDGKTIATGTQTGFDDRLVQMWDAATGKELRRFATGPKSVGAVAFSNDGKTLAASGPGDTITLWDPATGQGKGQLTAKGTRWIHALAFSPDGKKLVSGHENSSPPVDKSAPKPAVAPPRGEAWVWDLATKTPLQKLPHTNRDVRVVAFSVDGQKVLTAGAEDARLWQVDEGRELLRCTGHNGWVAGAALSHDGRLLATAGRRGRGIRLWEVASGEALVEFGETEAPFNALAFSADSKALISAGSDCCLLVWDVQTVLDKLRPVFFAAVALSEKELETLWSDLASGDVAVGSTAIRILAAVPTQSVSFLHKKADLPVPSKEVAKLVGDLDANEFVVREKATAELLKLDKPTVPSLRRMLDDSSSEETRQRLIYVLKNMGDYPFSPAHELREIRTVETLERIGGKEATTILEMWASQLPNSKIGREAKGALARQK